MAPVIYDKIMEETRQQYHELKSEMDAISGKVSMILQLLQGNDLNKEEGGLVAKVLNNEKRLQKLEQWRDRGVYIIIGVGIGAGIGITKIVSWFAEMAAK